MMDGERTDCFWCGADYNMTEGFCTLCGSTILTGPIEIVKYQDKNESDGVS